MSTLYNFIPSKLYLMGKKCPKNPELCLPYLPADAGVPPTKDVLGQGRRFKLVLVKREVLHEQRRKVSRVEQENRIGITGRLRVSGECMCVCGVYGVSENCVYKYVCECLLVVA